MSSGGSRTHGRRAADKQVERVLPWPRQLTVCVCVHAHPLLRRVTTAGEERAGYKWKSGTRADRPGRAGAL